MKRVFVYGTLLKGLERHSLLQGADFLGRARISGELHDIGAFPGLIAGDRTVHGELYRVDQRLLSALDIIEGYYEGDKNGSLFVRKDVSVHSFTDGHPVEACSYFYNGYVDSLIIHGDYRRYRHERLLEDQ